jgi:hypothetical protein
VKRLARLPSGGRVSLKVCDDGLGVGVWPTAEVIQPLMWNACWFRLLLVLLFSVVTRLQGGSIASSQTQSPKDPNPTYDACGSVSFTSVPDEHHTLHLPDPFRLRKVKGCITSEAGEWPEGVSVLIEIRSRSGDSTVYRAHTDRKGRFKFPKLPEGEYCFKAMTMGWVSVFGIVIVDKQAPGKARLNFVMPLEV